MRRRPSKLILICGLLFAVSAIGYEVIPNEIGSAAHDTSQRVSQAGASSAGSASPSSPARDDAPTTQTPDATPSPVIPRTPITRVGVATGAKEVALTIDDGPSPTWTPKVLDLLKHYGVHATFCLIGEQVVKFPELVRRIADEGHALCDHTWNHDEHLPDRSPKEIHDQITSTYDAIVAASGGVRPTFYRAPAGRWNDMILDEAAKLGMVGLGWSVDPRDWARPGTDVIVSSVLSKVSAGDVILMHDGGGDRSQSYAAMRRILPELGKRGLTLVVPGTT